MKANAKRTKTITVTKEVEIISHRLCTESLDANGSGAMWITLKRKCCLCGKRFHHEDSVSLCMYMEDGQRFSGGLHTSCLPKEWTEP